MATDWHGFESHGNVDKFPGLKAIIDAIWDKSVTAFALPSGITAYVRPFRNGALRGVELNGVLYIQQNPDTGSIAALRAQAGARIVWVMKESRYLGRIENDEVWLEPKSSRRVT